LTIEYETSCAYANFASSSYCAEVGEARFEPDVTCEDFSDKTSRSVDPHAENKKLDTAITATVEKKRRCNMNTFLFAVILQILALRIWQLVL